VDRREEIMSLIPAFKLGLWNAWILTLPIIVLSIFAAKAFGERESGEGPFITKKEDEVLKREKAVFAAHHIIFLASIAYSIFVPLKLGTLWFYGGLLIYVTGMLTETLALLSFYTTSVDKPVTEGVYSISRHPMYVGDFLFNIGISMCCLSWIFLLVAIMSVVLEGEIAVVEERWCLEKYGDAYREYISRAPKWIGIPKSRKSD
jgi:protein-S-isoprenylcysteine O-methyltransferase Ste14